MGKSDRKRAREKPHTQTQSKSASSEWWTFGCIHKLRSLIDTVVPSFAATSFFAHWFTLCMPQETFNFVPFSLHLHHLLHHHHHQQQHHLLFGRISSNVPDIRKRIRLTHCVFRAVINFHIIALPLNESENVVSASVRCSSFCFSKLLRTAFSLVNRARVVHTFDSRSQASMCSLPSINFKAFTVNIFACNHKSV